ncbi:hypothetical protein TrVE_jg4749 [Triparma verrucosa]|uniref:START domain-containing protein n=1 Tax=Triparma verrucosa TaxID=1606542 RepID=A0A9W7CBQ5_9STRA|nr:hypothetical protein TrVE_jg4749 [Triparma verrucosa]
MSSPNPNFEEVLTELKAARTKVESLTKELNAERRHRQNERTQFEKVVAEINNDVNLQLKRRLLDASSSTTEPLDRTDPEVKIIDQHTHLQSKVTTTNSCSFTVEIHDEPQAILEALKNDNQMKGFYQKVLRQDVVYWSFLLSTMKSCDLVVKLQVEKLDSGNEIVIKVCSVDDALYHLPTSPHSAASKQFRLLLKEGVILLRPLPFGQTSFTFTAQVDFGEIKTNMRTRQTTIVATTSVITNAKRGTSVTRLGKKSNSSKGGVTKSSFSASAEAGKANEVFCKIAKLFYNRFQKEDTIDAMKKLDFKNIIPNATPLTEAEHYQIAKAVELVDLVSSRAKRVVGTVNDFVEKFIHHPDDGGKMWAMTVANMDVSAVDLFTDLWLLDTFENRRENKRAAIREVWYNLDGTRGLQYAKSIGLPGFQDRLFKTWVTWEKRPNENGRHTYIISISPLEDYNGTHHEVTGAEKCVEATSRGVQVIKELTDNTCEWIRAQQADLKLSSAIPSSVIELVVMKEMASSDVCQDKYRRNGKEVDLERVADLSQVMRARRGTPLMEDQAAVFERCLSMAKDAVTGDDEDWKLKVLGWEDLDSPFPDVKMWIKYVDGKKEGQKRKQEEVKKKKKERSVATGRGVAIVDCSAEEVAALVMDYCSNERMRKSRENGHPARLTLRKEARENENTVATVKKMPAFLDNREFVARQIRTADKEGRMMVAIESVNDVVDYGVKLRKTRGFTRGLWIGEDLPSRGGAKQCRVIYIAQLDAGGVIPTWLVDKEVPQALSSVQEVVDEFRQDDRIDAAVRVGLSELMEERWGEEVYSEGEQLLIDKGKATIKAIVGSANLKVLESGDPLVTLKTAYLENDKLVTGIAESVVDGKLEEVAAFECLKMSREATRNFHRKGGIRNIVKKTRKFP